MRVRVSASIAQVVVYLLGGRVAHLQSITPEFKSYTKNANI